VSHAASLLLADALLLVAGALGAQDSPASAPPAQRTRAEAGRILYRHPPPGPRSLQFDSLRSRIASGRTTVVNGQAVLNPADWQAVVLARFSNGTYCSGTIIGPRVLLTAAHCLDAGTGPKAAVNSGFVTIGHPYKLTGCEMHEDYAAAGRPLIDEPRMSEDYGLCELNGTPHIIDETLASDPIAPGTPVLITGYGCYGITVIGNSLEPTRIDAPGAETLRLGDVRLQAVGVEDESAKPGAYLRVRSTKGQPALCPGDSGGPAITGATVAKQGGAARRVVGVNSMVSAWPVGAAYDYYSYLASTGAPAFRSFLTRWSAKSPGTRQVCGVDLSHGSGTCHA
jgi:hypothetical protein